MRALFGRVRRVVGQLFYRFGIHCATHQIRVILICAVVITSLFYPALAIYTSSTLKPISSYLLPSGWLADAGLLADLQEPWQPHRELRVADDYDSRLRCGLDATVRVERVVVESVHKRADGALNAQTLHAALQLEHRINTLLQQPGAPQCVETQPGSGDCFVLSPLQYWSHSAQTVERDTDLVATINKAPNVSALGITTKPGMLFGSITWSDDDDETDMAQAEVLVTTYFFQDTGCDSLQGHAAWESILRQAVGDAGALMAWPRESVLLPLQYRENLTTVGRFSVISAFLYLTYIVVFFNFSGSMRSVNTVHSLLGLAVTGLVEILASTITSISVLALWGFRVTLVPWGILPLIIVFVGAENMFFMINSVVRTAVTLPVKERIALGVSEAGTSNTLKAVTYNSVLGTIAFFAGGGTAIRQFCVFAIVVLVAHWFLIHTLFLTVLSIDLQRLELSEVLQQDPGVSPSSATLNSNGTRSASAVRGGALQRLVRSRATKDGSLLLILAVTVIMYYVTYPSPDAQARDEADPFARHSQRTSASAVATAAVTPALRLWQTLNPLGKKLVHLRVEPPTLVQWVADGRGEQPWSAAATAGRRLLALSNRRTRALLWALKIVILPIAGTCGVLYALLIRLLKNTELLEAQRARPDGYLSDGRTTPVGAEEDGGACGGAAFSTLPRAFASDAEMFAIARETGVCASVSADNVLAVWAPGGRPCAVVDVGEALGVVTALAIDSAGRCVAVGTTAGMLGLWVVDAARGTACGARVLGLETVRSPVAELGFVRHVDPADGSSALCVVATHEDGVVLDWDLSVTPRPAASFVQPASQSTSTIRTLVVHERDRDAVGVAFVLDNGAVEVVDCLKGPGAWTTTSCIQAGPFHDSVIQVARVRFEVCDAPVPRAVLVTLSRLGVLRLWDAQTGEMIMPVDNVNPGSNFDLRELQASAMAPHETACERCREQTAGGFVLALGAGETVLVYRALVGERCACSLAGTSGKVVAVGRRSRAGSTAPPPLRSRISLQQHRVPANFPISGHGFHSRRSSEKEHRRAALAAEDELTDISSANGGAPESATPGRWRDLTVRYVAEVPCERGAWSLMGTRVVGVRRRARGTIPAGPPPQPLLGETCALSAAVLQRWEAWVLDLCQLSPVARASTLYALSAAPSQATGSRSRSVSRQPSLSSLPLSRKPSALALAADEGGRFPRLPFTRASGMRVAKKLCFIGLGNTVGVLELPPPPLLPPESSSTASSSPVVSRPGSIGPASGSLIGLI